MTIINTNQHDISSLVNSLQGTVSASFFSFNGRKVSLKEEEVNLFFDKVPTLESIYTQDQTYRRPRKVKPIEQPQDQIDTQDLNDPIVSSDDEQTVSPEATSSDDAERRVTPFCGSVKGFLTIDDFAADDSDLDTDFVPDEQIEDEVEIDVQEENDDHEKNDIQEEHIQVCNVDDDSDEVVVEQDETAVPVISDASYMQLRSGRKVYFKPELVKLYRYFPPASRLPLNCR